MKVALHFREHSGRAREVGYALSRGLRKHGDTPSIRGKGDVYILYGMSPTHKKLYEDFKDKDVHFFIIDLGYWHRGRITDPKSYYKISYKYWHPNAYLNELDASPKRFQSLGVTVKPWTKNQDGPILLAGMGPKSDSLYGYKSQEWDINIVTKIQEVTDRQILYRPKPSWKTPIPIKGTTFSPSHEPLAPILKACHSVVTHHSNVGVDALTYGIPVFSVDGAASLLSMNQLDEVERPRYTGDRNTFFNKLAYCQWSVEEMASGKAWEWLRGAFIK